jgi:hypothetical protein
MVQTIDRDRKSLPWDPTKTEPVKRAGMWEVRDVVHRSARKVAR